MKKAKSCFKTHAELRCVPNWVPVFGGSVSILTLATSAMLGSTAKVRKNVRCDFDLEQGAKSAGGVTVLRS
jgi:hypothetical protein